MNRHLTGLLTPESHGLYAGNETRAGLGSLVVHAAMLALLLWLGSMKTLPKILGKPVMLIAPPPLPLKVAQNKGGGGGGARQPEVKKEDPPKSKLREFTPPRVDTFQTRLEVPSAAIDAPDISPGGVGSLAGLSSPGGSGVGGFGGGLNGGIGGEKGPGVGPGPGGNSTEGIYRPGSGVTNPVPIFQPEPQYSEEARKAKWQGAVLLSLVVDEQGKPIDIRVIRSLGLGLDEKAVEAVGQWRFQAGMLGGKPVKVQAQIEVTFRLL